MILPRLHDAFEWQSIGDRPAIVCRPLAGVARHVFTTRQWPLGAANAAADGVGWESIARALDVGLPDLLRARQVHGTAITVGRPRPGWLPEADILMASDSSVAVAIQVADCVPILIADPVSGAVGAVHAGWRGLASRAPVAAVDALRREFGCRPQDLLAALGPSIGACCYQVGMDVHERFRDAGHPSGRLQRWFLDRPTAVPGNPPIPVDVGRTLERPLEGGRHVRFFDAWTCAQDQLVDAGVAPARVFSAALCTASHPALLCSYRRDGRAAGRLAAAIRCGAPRPSPALRDEGRAS